MKLRQTIFVSAFVLLVGAVAGCSGDSAVDPDPIEEAVAAEWVWQSPLPQGNALNAIHFNPTLDVGVAVGVKGAIVRTLDKGASWQSVKNPTSEQLFDVAMADATIGVAVGEGGTLIRTTSAGASWAPVEIPTTETLQRVAFASPTVGVATGHVGTIIRTNDGGVSWSLVRSGTQNTLRDVDFVSSDEGFILGGNILLHTRDGGEEWNLVEAEGPDGSFAASNIDFLDALYGFALGVGQVFETKDRGNTWSLVVEDEELEGGHDICVLAKGQAVLSGDEDVFVLSDGDLSNVFGNGQEVEGMFAANNKDVFGVGEVGLILRSTNGGNAWVTATETVSGELSDVEFVDAATGFATMGAGTMLTTSDGGETWNEDTFYPTFALQFDFVSTQIGMAVSRTKVLRTTDGGSFWAEFPAPFEEKPLDFEMMDTDRAVVVGDASMIYRTENGGVDWLSADTRPTDTATLNDVAFGDSNVGVAVGFADGLGIIWRTQDGGQVWKEVATLSTTAIRDVAFAGTETVVIVGVQVIHRSTDAGRSWVRVDLEAEPRWGLLAVDFFDEMTGYAAGSPGLILKTEDRGLTWAQQPTPATRSFKNISAISGNIASAVGQRGMIMRSVPVR